MKTNEPNSRNIQVQRSNSNQLTKNPHHQREESLFENNRTDSVSQRRLQDMANNSSQVKQLSSLQNHNQHNPATLAIQKINDQQVIQRTTIKEILHDGRIGISHLYNIVTWLEKRTGGEIQGRNLDENNWNRFLHDLTLEEVVNYAQNHANRIAKENRVGLTLQDFIDYQSATIKWGTVVSYLNNSSVGKYTRIKLVPDSDPIVILADHEFTEAHLSELQQINQIEVLDEDTLFEHNREIDTVNGFHSKVNGKIHIRQEAAMDGNYHFPVHEAIHKCSHSNFSKLLGHAFNEAATEMIARKVCQEHGIKLYGQPYEAEIALLTELWGDLGFGSYKELEDAYFMGKVSTAVEGLKVLLKSDEYYADFIAAKNAKTARLIYDISKIVPQSLDSLGLDLDPIVVKNHSNGDSQTKDE